MNQILYERRCKCKEKLVTNRSRHKKKRGVEKIHQYPSEDRYFYEDSSEIFSKTFRIKLNKNLSLTAKFLLNNFQNKYLYYAMDDIKYLLNISLEEKNYLLEIIYSPILSLHNNFSINFFDIWINEIYIDELIKSNRFLNSTDKILTQNSIITIKFLYKLPIAPKKRVALW